MVASAALLLLASQSPSWAADNLPSGVNAVQKGHGQVFTNERGMTLYTFDRDEGAPGKSTCNGECAVAWPPLVAPADAKPPQNWTIITRDDGAKQWSYKGKPIYTYAADAFPGATFGDGVGTVWRLAFQPIATPAEVSIASTILGHVLTDAKGMTLYSPEGERSSGKSTCSDDCLKTWVPLVAPWVANPAGDWTVIARGDGVKQWAYKGQPLYRHTGDINPGEVNGNGNKDWRAIVLEPAPALPPWATFQASDAGELIGNEQGLTVYTHSPNARGRRANPACPGDCVGEDWVPFTAAPDAKSVGSWVVIDLPDGAKQWSYKGQKVYTNKLDKKPGDFKGIRFGGDRSFSTVMRSGQPMQGVSAGG